MQVTHRCLILWSFLFFGFINLKSLINKQLSFWKGNAWWKVAFFDLTDSCLRRMFGTNRRTQYAKFLVDGCPDMRSIGEKSRSPIFCYCRHVLPMRCCLDFNWSEAECNLSTSLGCTVNKVSSFKGIYYAEKLRLVMSKHRDPSNGYSAS